MRQLTYDTWNSIMDANWNPLRHIKDMQVRHLVLQLLAWMWCITFSLYFGSFVIFAHDGTLKFEDAQAPSKYEDIW